MAFLSLSNSFLMFFIIWSLPRVDYAVCFDLLFSRLWASSSLSFAMGLRLQHSMSLQVRPPFQFFILFHQLLHISNECLNLLGHYGWIRKRWWNGSVHVSQGTLLVEIQWWLAWENCNSIVPHKQCQTEEARICLVNMFLISWWTTCKTRVAESTQWIRAPTWGLPRTFRCLS